MTPRDYRWRVWQGKKCPWCGANSWLEVFTLHEKPVFGNSVRCCTCDKRGTASENGTVQWDN